jgi:opacity protein-like surface antigen
MRGALMKKNSVVLMVSASLIAGNALAGPMGPLKQNQSDWGWVGAISAGPVWARGGETQLLFLTPELERTYVANKSTKTLFNGEAFLGLHKSLTQIMKAQLGLAVGYAAPVRLSNDIWDGIDVDFNNYISYYKIQHTHIALKGKLLADAGYWVTPWISGSLGAGFNKAYGFSSAPIIFEALPISDFSSHTQTAFTYTVGAGLQKTLSEHWQVGVGYEFADWGKSHLGRAEGQTQNNGIGLNHLYTNGVLLNLTFTI